MNARTIIRLFLITVAVTLTVTAFAQQPADKSASESAVEELASEKFTQLVKQAWSFLKDESEKYVNQAESRSEFETKSDFDQRLGSFGQQYFANVAKYIKDQKLDQRVFSVQFKAILEKYNVQTEMYAIGARETIEAPYTIPTVQCAISPNAFVALTDSIRQGYRLSSIHLNFKPNLSLKMSRDVAASAKADEAGFYFQIHFQIKLDSSRNPAQSRLLLVPKRIALVNTNSQRTYWERAL